MRDVDAALLATPLDIESVTVAGLLPALLRAIAIQASFRVLYWEPVGTMLGALKAR